MRLTDGLDNAMTTPAYALTGHVEQIYDRERELMENYQLPVSLAHTSAREPRKSYHFWNRDRRRNLGVQKCARRAEKAGEEGENLDQISFASEARK